MHRTTKAISAVDATRASQMSGIPVKAILQFADERKIHSQNIGGRVFVSDEIVHILKELNRKRPEVITQAIGRWTMKHGVRTAKSMQVGEVETIQTMEVV
jgi:hypothetical protein